MLSPSQRIAVCLGLALAGLHPVPEVTSQAPSEVVLWVPPEALNRTVSVTVDGQPVAVESAVAAEIFAPERVVVLFDRWLSDPRTVRNGAVFLGERSATLAALAPVEIAVLDQEVDTRLPPTRETELLRDTLEWFRVRESVEDVIGELRRDLRAAAEQTSTDNLAALAEAAFVTESLALRSFHDALLRWAADRPTPEPRLLLLVSSGWDLDPRRFYENLLAEQGLTWTVTEGPDRLAEATQAVAQTLAAYGWVVVPFAPTATGDALLAGSPRGSTTDPAAEGFIRPDSTAVMLRVKPGRGEEEDVYLPVRREPLAALDRLAVESGGTVAADSLQLDAALRELRARRSVEFNPPTGEGDLVPVAVVSGGEPVPTSQWLLRRTPQPVLAARARGLLEGLVEPGDLGVAALLQPAERGTELVVELGTAPRAPRATIGVVGEDGTVQVEERPLADLDRVGTSRWQLAMGTWSLEDEPPVVIVVEDSADGSWGGAFASYVQAPLTTRAEWMPPTVRGRSVQLVPPADPVVFGRAPFEAVVYSGDSARVEFLVDGEREAVRRSPPFRAQLDFGELPQVRRVEVVAYDEKNREIGRDTAVVNSGVGELKVALRTPDTEMGDDGSLEVAQSFRVLADVTAPTGSTVERVVFYWRDQEQSTVFTSPFAHTVQLPSPSAPGFVRVVAYSSDGSAAEDVLFVNSPGPSERLQVTLVELYAVVTDRTGRPVAGLEPEDFVVTEEGVERQITTFSSAADLPLTVGLAIDSSASMFVKLPDVQVAANQFLRTLFTERDRGFLVGFGDRPTLQRTTTSDLRQLIGAVNDLAPSGKTAIWKSIVYSLVQLQGVPGKKALIVYSDGADEDPDFSYRLCRRFSRRVGVPIYVILSNNEIVRTSGQGLNVRGFLGRLEQLVDEVGGRVFTARVGDDLAGVYQRIGEELRSQYVLGYYAEQGDDEEWRRVQVRVRDRGLDVRAPAGYYP